jgi:DNA gyrase subunit A
MRPTATRPDGLAPEFGLSAQGYRLSDAQAQAILELRLQRLTGLEQDKIVAEYREVMDVIADLLDILARPERITQIIGDELRAHQAAVRRPASLRDGDEVPPRINMEDLITPAGHGRDPVPHRLLQAPAAHRLPCPEARRPRQAGGGQ